MMQGGAVLCAACRGPSIQPEGKAEKAAVAGGVRADRGAAERALTQSARTWLTHFNVGQALKARWSIGTHA